MGPQPYYLFLFWGVRSKYQIYDKAINKMCDEEQKSLVYIHIDTLTVNETALQQLGLLESQVLF